MVTVEGGSEDSFGLRMPIEESSYACFATKCASMRGCQGGPRGLKGAPQGQGEKGSPITSAASRAPHMACLGAQNMP